MTDRALPDEVLASAVPSGKEFGWRPARFVDALQRAASRDFACLGGQFQWVLADGTCEPYWLNVESSPRTPEQSWHDYVLRCEKEVSQGFSRLLSNTDFDREAKVFAFLQQKLADGFPIHDHLLFVAYFVTAKCDE